MPIFNSLLNAALPVDEQNRIFHDIRHDSIAEGSAKNEIQPIDVIPTLILLSQLPQLEYTLLLDWNVADAKKFLAALDQFAADPKHNLGFVPTQMKNFHVKVVSGEKELASFIEQKLSNKQAGTATVTGRKKIDSRFKAMKNLARVLVKKIQNHTSTIAIVAARINELTKNSLDHFDDEQLASSELGARLMKEVALLQAYLSAA